MAYEPELEPTPLRLRLGHRSHTSLFRPVDDMLGDASLVDQVDTDRLGASDDGAQQPEPIASVMTPEEPVREELSLEAIAADIEEPHRPTSWNQQLERAVEQSARRMDRWIVEQRRRVTENLDTMLVQLEQRRQTELAKLEEWKVAERARVEREMADERERFRDRLMQELVAFEEQLGLRLREQEERLTRWWDEAEQMAAQRFAALGLEPRAEES
jgi:hypothetical protein